MTLESILENAVAKQHETGRFGQTVTFNGTDIQASVVYENSLDERTGAVMAIAKLEVQASVISPLIADPRSVKDITVIIDSKTWIVKKLLNRDNAAWLFECHGAMRPVI